MIKKLEIKIEKFICICGLDENNWPHHASLNSKIPLCYDSRGDYCKSLIINDDGKKKFVDIC